MNRILQIRAFALAWYFVTATGMNPLPQPNTNVLPLVNVYHGPYETKDACEKEQAKHTDIVEACKEEEDAGGS